MQYKIAVVQMDSGDDTEENLVKLEKYISRASENGADLVIFPEHAEYLGMDYGNHAFSVPGKITRFFASCAEKYGIYVHCGTLTEKKEGGRPYNTSVLFTPKGEMAGCYRKLHMFDVAITGGPGYRESAEVSAGDEIEVCDTEFGKIGLAICYDLRFPELFRIMAKQGAGLMVLSANFTENTGKAHWETLLRARAIENTCYVAAAGQCGKKDAFEAYGHSMVIDPWGEVIARAGTGEEIIYAVIDTEWMEEVRRQIPSLANVREDVYELSSKGKKTVSDRR